MTFAFRFHQRNVPCRVIALAVFIFFALPFAPLTAAEISRAYGLESRSEAKVYLQMPDRADGAFPRLLSQTGAFKDTPHLVPGEVLIPYDLIVPFWSDGATKSRWISVPDGKIKFTPTGEWIFPRGTVFVKTFELATNETRPNVKRRL